MYIQVLGIKEEFNDAVATFFATLNYCLYSFIESIYNFLINLAGVQIINSATLQEFSTRIYAILAIFMAFKLTFSFINYAVKPDDLTDKSKGGKQLVVNIIVSLVLLIAVPNLIFPLSRQLQTAILNDSILEQVILGVDVDAGGDVTDTKRAGRTLSFSVLNGFFYPNPLLKGESEGATCENSVMILDEEAGYEDASDQKELQNALYKLNGSCAQAILEKVKKDAGDTVFWYETAYTQKSISMLLLSGKDAKNLKVVRTEDDEYVFTFNYIIALAAAVAVIWLLITFSFKVAVRSIKLAFLELVAPIPILSYIDPKTKGKSFDGWVKACATTYVDLFIRLIALYFALFVISSMTKNGGLTFADGKPVDPITMVVIILGALMFINEVPKLIGDIFGVKLDGNFSLNPFKGSPLAAGLVGGAIGAAGGSLLGGVNNYQAHRELGHGRLRSFTSGLGGIATGAARGGTAGAKDQGFAKGMTGLGGFGSSFFMGAGSSSVGAKKIQAKEGTSFLGRNVAKIQNKAHLDDQWKRIEKRTKNYSDLTSNIGSYKSKMRDEVSKNKGGAYDAVARAKATHDMLQNMNTSGMNSTQMAQHAQDIVAANADYERLMKDAINTETNRQLHNYKTGNYAAVVDADILAKIDQNLSDNVELYKTTIDGKEFKDANGNKITDALMDANVFYDVKDAVTSENVRISRDEKTIKAKNDSDYASNVIGPHEHPHGK